MSTIEHIVMPRVRRIHVLRRILNPTALKTYGLALCLFALLSAVSVAHVIANMPPLVTPGAFVRFVFNAFTNTELVVQFLVAGVCVASGMLACDAMRVFGRPRSLTHA